MNRVTVEIVFDTRWSADFVNAVLQHQQEQVRMMLEKLAGHSITIRYATARKMEIAK
jgi:ribulose bisphosphate carboxylase small subunit